MARHTFDLSRRTPFIFLFSRASHIVLRLADWEALSAHAIESYPNESVGILSSADNSLTDGYDRLTNELCERAFSVSPASLRAVLGALEKTERIPLVLCHSHPNGVADLSMEDIRDLRHWPALIGVLAVLERRVLDFRVFSIESGQAIRSIPITLLTE